MPAVEIARRLPGGLHEALRHAGSVAGTVNVKPLQFDGVLDVDAGGRRLAPYLGKGDQGVILEAQHRDHGGIENLAGLLRQAEGCGEMSPQIFRPVIRTEGFGEGTRCKFRQRGRVGGDGNANFEGIKNWHAQGWNQRSSITMNFFSVTTNSALPRGSIAIRPMPKALTVPRICTGSSVKGEPLRV